MKMDGRAKSDCFQRKESGKFVCLICQKELSSKRNVQLHLVDIHGASPLKKVRKLYDETVEHVMPKSTFYYRRRQQRATMKEIKAEDAEGLNSENNVSVESTETIDDSERESPVFSVFRKDGTTFVEPQQNPGASIMEGMRENHDYNTVAESTDDDHSEDDSSDEFDTASEFSTTDDESDFSDDMSDDDDDDYDITNTPTICSSEDDERSLILLSIFLKHNLSAACCKDILETMKKLIPESKNAFDTFLSYKHMWSLIDVKAKEVHYCFKCSNLFPENLDQRNCSKCGYDRYEDNISVTPKGRFVFPDPKESLKNLLTSPGILESILNPAPGSFGDIICDIKDGACYKSTMDEWHVDSIKISGLFNTDGVLLYNSTKVQLWPILLSVNELPPTLRFARDNTLICGLWQGKGKPPMETYLNIFTQNMNVLKSEGVDVEYKGEIINVKLNVALCSLDLPAKASVLNMTMFNGKCGCCMCYDPGEVVSKGKGHVRCYDYHQNARDRAKLFKRRTDVNVREDMILSTDKKRVNGYKGKSGISDLIGFDLVKGVVPDYMHGSLLGAVKKLLDLWFSPTNSGENYFIGKQIKEVSKNVAQIMPPQFIERLPRKDFDKQYSHMKATELQAWLLYYASPCLDGILDKKYLDHFELLSEGIFLLLGDQISPDQLDRADALLTKFYQNFSKLYGKENCGINIHNIGLHTVESVRNWGPLWDGLPSPSKTVMPHFLNVLTEQGIVAIKL